MLAQSAPDLVHYLPILSTILCAAFLVQIARRAMPRRWPPHLAWWAVGVFFYGLGTLIESAITLAGNGPSLNRLWYWAGAILGGYPLATGTVYLLLRRPLAHLLTALSLALVIFASLMVFITPLNLDALQPHRPSGDVIAWRWIRLLTPVINGYAALFLIGGALYSSIRFAFPGAIADSPEGLPRPRNGPRAAGTLLIAIGGILPGIGGGMAKAGVVEALYIGELAGIILIWLGYECCLRSPVAAADHAPRALASA